MDRAHEDRHPEMIRGMGVTEVSPTTGPAKISRRAALGGAVGGALVTLIALPEVAAARVRNPASLVLLLKGLYQPVVTGPDLGLSTVDLNDGSYSTTKIYPVSGVPGHRDVLEAIGDFYVQFSGNLCAYDIPGGALAMKFNPTSNTESIPDGSGGSYLQGSFELRVREGTGQYRSFADGHNTMIDNLHFLASGGVDEYCLCFINTP